MAASFSRIQYTDCNGECLPSTTVAISPLDAVKACSRYCNHVKMAAVAILLERK
jgi:hypothetical protein